MPEQPIEDSVKNNLYQHKNNIANLRFVNRQLNAAWWKVKLSSWDVNCQSILIVGPPSVIHQLTIENRLIPNIQRPQRKTISSRINKWRTTGTVLDKSSGGRPRISFPARFCLQAWFGEVVSVSSKHSRQMGSFKKTSIVCRSWFFLLKFKIFFQWLQFIFHHEFTILFWNALPEVESLHSQPLY